MNKKILEKSLQQLEKEFPNEILPEDKLPLLPREKDFSKILLKDFNNENLRFMINQGLGWKFLVPIAIEVLQENPFAEGGYGNLLGSVLNVKDKFWQNNPSLYQKVEEILQNGESIETEEAKTTLTILLPKTIYDFRKNKPKING